MSFDKIFDLTAGVYLYFYKSIIIPVCYSLYSLYIYIYIFFFSHTRLLSGFWTSHGHRCRSFSPRSSPSIFIARRVQQSYCSSIFHLVLLAHPPALSAGQFVPKKKSPRTYTSMHSGGFKPTKLTYTRLEDNLIRHRGDRVDML